MTIEEALDHGLGKNLLAHYMKAGSAYYALMCYATCQKEAGHQDHTFFTWAHDQWLAKGNPPLTPNDMRALSSEWATVAPTEVGQRYRAEHDAHLAASVAGGV